MNLSDREVKGIWCPIEIWTCKELSIVERHLLNEIDSFDKKGKGCFASNDYFAEFLGISEASVVRAIAHLKELNAIEFVSFDGRVRVLKSNKDEFVRVVKMTTLPMQNDLHINTSIVSSSKEEADASVEASVKKMVRQRPTLHSLKERIKKTMPEKTVADIFRTDPMIDFWNTLPHVRKLKPETKLYEQTRKAIKSLRNGYYCFAIFDKEWKDRHVLPSSHSDFQITQGFERLSMMLTDGYFPRNKESLRAMSLSDMIYNPRTQKSLFIEVMTTPPKQIAMHSTSPFIDYATQVCSKYLMNGNSSARVAKHFDAIALRYAEIPRKCFTRGSDLNTFRGTIEKFLKSFVEFIDNQDWIKERSVHMFEPTGKVFEKFVKEKCGTDSNSEYINLSKWLL